MPAARQSATEQLQRTAQSRKKEQPAQSALQAQSSGDLMIGRIPVLDVRPVVDCGRRPAKAVAGETFQVTATVFREGHDAVAANVVLRDPNGRSGPWTPMRELVPGTDRWGAEITPDTEGLWAYAVEAWSDPVATWRQHARIKIPAGIDTALVLAEGADLHERAAAGVPKSDGREAVLAVVDALRDEGRPAAARLAAALATEAVDALARHPLRELVSASRPLPLLVERRRALYGSWYELFPRSEGAVVAEGSPPVSGTFRTAAERLPAVAAMGFDVVYLPPVHPIGTTHRKGPDNSLNPGAHDVGVPWAIGSREGGHDALHADLGTFEDFDHFVATAHSLRMEVALDFALQCSPDHPWVKKHPGWFHHRADGTIAYAENPPKKYEDIYPFNFETEDWPALWRALRDVFVFWIEQGVRIFRVDNPHTKPFAFWEWVIQELKTRYPDIILLSEAFTRPNVMYHLARIGFTQSYTYFAWRNASWEIRDYFRELTQTQVREYFRPNLWPNTPDILNAYLQTGGRPAFMTRLVLAATLGANYGIYGPAFELCESRPREPGSEEYLNSEKYEVRHWDLDTPQSLREFIALVNRIRRENRALQSNRGLIFHPIDNEAMICYSKQTDDRSNAILVVVVLDPLHRHSAWVDLDLGALGIEPEHPFQVHDLLTGGRYGWQGPRNYVELDPASVPAHVLRIEAPQT